jgi:hexosaminidase
MAHSTEDGELALLLPPPQRLRLLSGHWRLPRHLKLWLHGEAEVMPALAWLEQALAARGHAVERATSAAVSVAALGGAAAPFRLELCGSEREPAASAVATAALANATALPHALQHATAQGYTLDVGQGFAAASALSAAGLQYAIASLTQLVESSPGEPGQLHLPCCALEDWPDFPERGVMLDVSRDKVPKLDTLYALIERLARWKVNQLQLYMEHTFAYAGHEVVWQRASPYTAAEVRALDAYCAARHVELVPNQNSFGHMQRWLAHEPYRNLAECPEGFEHPWNWGGEPYGLCATDPKSLVFLEGLYDQLLPNFRSRRFNVGLDETLDLGAGRSRAACEARGTERVYLDFLQAVHARVLARGHSLQFWGDIIVKRPDLIAELPKEALALEWGYEPDHPFAEHLALFQKAGLGFYVCPGTSSWNSIAGRSDNAIANIALAARAGKAAGASGLLLTDWGDNGHLQPLPVSYLGFVLGAAWSWNVAGAERAADTDVPQLLDVHAFMDSAGVLGRVAVDLGNTYREAGSLRPNASVLFWSLIKPERLFSPPGVTRASLEHALAYIERVSEPLAHARPAAPDGALVVSELGWVSELLRFACRLGLARCTPDNVREVAAIPRAQRAELARELGTLIERHRAQWLARNRPGGLDDSAGRLEKLREELLA